MSNVVLACEQLAKTYTDGSTHTKVLRQMDLVVNHSEIIAVMGSSGSGKSTFLHLLGGLDKPTQGKVFLQGKNLYQLSEAEKCRMRNQYLGFVYQFHHLLPEFSALENVGMPLLIRGEKPEAITMKAEKILDEIGLKHRLNHRLGELSGGERQRVAIARALVTNPLCVLADEPTGNLDPKNADRVLQLFFNLQKTIKTSIVMVTHDPGIAKYGNRVFTIEDGQLIETAL